MARQRDPNRDKSFEMWKEHNGDITNREIANILGADEKKIAVWKQRDKWNGNVVQQNTKNVVQQKVKIKKEVEPPFVPDEEITLDNFLEDSELTEKQRIFCLYYVKSFNATQSAINAGYSPATAHVQGPRLLGNVRVSDEIKRVKQSMTSELYIEAMDVLNKYIKIAFSDITDFLTFGQKWVPVIGMMGPVLDDDGNQVMKEVNYVDFKESGTIDGTIISEVKQGKDGVSIKLEDRKWALDKLAMYFDLFPDNFKRRIEEEKLKLAQQKAKEESNEGKTNLTVVFDKGMDDE